MNEINEKCAVFGVWGNDIDVAKITYFGLYALQHRGQENSGIATTDGDNIICYKNKGLVAQVFNENIIKKLNQDNKAYCAIGHNRYSTSGGIGIYYAQPVIICDNSSICENDEDIIYSKHNSKIKLSLVHNGNLPSTKALKDFLIKNNIDIYKLSSNICHNNSNKHLEPSDSILITEALYFYLYNGLSIEDTVEKVYPLLTGSFSILIMTDDKLIAIRDRYGIRPLSMGKLNEAYVFSSETCAFHTIGAKHIRDVLPGEMIIIDKEGMKNKQLYESNQKLDIFEFVYFSRPDSDLLGKSVYSVRKSFGEELANQCSNIEADVIIPVPETAIPVAIGYSNISKIPFEMGLIKSRYIHRTFIEPDQNMRERGVKLKLSPLKEFIENKRVIIIDDSLVRGTTSKQLIKMLFETGAREVHFIISSPPIRYPDFYGIDLPDQEKLFAFKKTIEEMRLELGSTTLNFLSFENMIKATGLNKDIFCTSCFTGEYPIDLFEAGESIVK